MAIFSLKSSREAALHRTYTEAYQASLQSILKESSFDEAGALVAWKETLAHITSGMAQLDGSPPKNAQEMSLLTSIMDIERQCHDKIPRLEGHLQQKSRSNLALFGQATPVATNHVPDFAPNVSGLSLNERKRPSRVAVGSKAPSVPASPAASQTIHPIAMPKAGDMPYGMYTQKPTIPLHQQQYSTPEVQGAPPLAQPVAAPAAPPHNPLKARKEAKKAAKELKKKEEVKKDPHRSSLDYPQSQPAPGGHGHSMLSTLRSKTMWRRKHTPANSLTRLTPSQEDVSAPALQAAQQTAAHQTTAQPTPAQPSSAHRTHLQQPSPTVEHRESPMFHGFDSVCAPTGQTSPTTGPLKSPLSSPQLQSSAQFSASPKQAHSSPSMPSAVASPPAAASPAPAPRTATPPVVRSSPASHSTSTHHAKPSYHSSSSAPSRSVSPPAKQTVQPRASYKVAYDKVSTSTGRTILRPRVVRSPVVSQKSSPRSSANLADAQSAQKFSNSSSRPSPRESPKPSPEPESGDIEMDEWDRMAHAKIKDLRGVDKNAAKQIISEIVLKGDRVAWDDIAGLDRAKASLKETVVYPFLRPDLFMGLREPVLGMLLFGPPGTGKTMLARAVAAESKSTFFSISASSLTSKYMGESEKLVRALFQIAKALAPSIIFVDEIDSILTQRADSGEHEASRRIKNEFLVQWSDLQSAAAGKNNEDSEVRRVLVLGATNLPWAIDEAARRRFVRRQYIPLPEPYTRRVHLEKLLSHQKHAISDAELDHLVDLTDGYSGSDLTALAKDAAMGPLRSLGDALLTTAPDQIRNMGMSDFVESMNSIRPSVSPEGLHAFEQWAAMYGSSGA